jgi:poly(hydroxyalkanoate) granule-associated protein
VQKESVRLFEALVEEGKRAEARRGKAAHSPAPVALKALGDQALVQVQHLQQRVEEGSARVLHWVGLPSQVDIQDLSSRLDALQASIQELSVARQPPTELALT